MFVHTDWLLTPERVAVHLPTATGVIADLHLGYGQARRRRGDAVPVTGLDDLRRAVAALRARHGLRRLVIAGDLCEDSSGLPLLPDLLSALQELRVELVGVVPGNHDRGLAESGVPLPLRPDGVPVGQWLVVHGDGDLPQCPVVLGHFHPCLRWGARLAAPCYLVGQRRIVLPAFSPDAAGVNVLGEPRWRGYRGVAVADDRLLDFGDVSRLAARGGG
jgi:hypothetical protein